MAEWYYMKDGEKQGPVSTPQLKQLAAAGELRPDDQIWREGLEGWAKASQAKGLFGGSEPPPLLSQDKNLSDVPGDAFDVLFEYVESVATQYTERILQTRWGSGLNPKTTRFEVDAYLYFTLEKVFESDRHFMDTIRLLKSAEFQRRLGQAHGNLTEDMAPVLRDRFQEYQRNIDGNESDDERIYRGMFRSLHKRIDSSSGNDGIDGDIAFVIGNGLDMIPNEIEQEALHTGYVATSYMKALSYITKREDDLATLTSAEIANLPCCDPQQREVDIEGYAEILGESFIAHMGEATVREVHGDFMGNMRKSLGISSSLGADASGSVVNKGQNRASSLRGIVLKTCATSFKWFRKACVKVHSILVFIDGIGRGGYKGEPHAVKWYRKAAKQGDAEAQYHLGRMYYTGDGVRQNNGQAAKWVRKAAERGHVEAQGVLGAMYDSGRGVLKDYTQAVKWYRKAAEQGLAVAQYTLGYMYENGRGVLKDEAQAVKWYRKAAAQGIEEARSELKERGLRWDEAAEQANAEPQHNVDPMYAEKRTVQKDYAQAFKWALEAAEQGCAGAQFEVGAMYAEGEGVAKDEPESVKWFRKAAEQGDANAQGELGDMYDEDLAVQQDYAKAVELYRKAAVQGDADAQYELGLWYTIGQGDQTVKWVRKAAEQGHVKAQCFLGLRYAEGDGLGVQKDDAQAIKWWRKSAKQGYAKAQFYLGFMYTKGQGVQEDATQAFKWYRKAARQGNAEAQFYLGNMYLQGQGVRQGYTKAAKWLRKAAEQGDSNAQFVLGYMCFRGCGVQEDEGQAVKWWRKSAEQGNTEARTELKKRGLI